MFGKDDERQRTWRQACAGITSNFSVNTPTGWSTSLALRTAPDIGRGQAQKWFYVRLRDTDAPVAVDRIDERKGTPEFTSYAWMSFAELVSKAVPFRQRVYDRVAEHARTLTGEWAD